MTPETSISQNADGRAVETTANRNNSRLFVLGVILLALLGAGLRVGFVAARGAGDTVTFADERDYWSMANSLAAGDTMTDVDGRHATRMPGYPAFLSLFAERGGPAAARIAQSVIGGAGIVVFVALIGRRVAGERAGLIAAAIVAIDPFSVFFSNLLLAETLFIVVLWCLVWLTWPRASETTTAFMLRAAAAALAWAAGIYLHPSAVIIGAAVIAIAAIRLRPIARGAGAMAVGVGVVIVTLVPWAMRNGAVVGERIWLTTRGGITLYDGVGPQATGSSDLAYTREIPAVASLDEAAWDGWFADESRRLIREQPGRVVRLAWPKFVRTWSPAPNAADYRSAAYRVISAAWTLPLYVLACLGVWHLRGRWGDLLLLLVPAVVITLVHMILPGSVRYRLPAMPGLAILAAVGVAVVMRWKSETTPALRV